MGVELGKVLAKAILAQLDKPEDVTGHDGSVRIPVFHHYSFRVLKHLATDDRSHPLLPEVQEGVNKCTIAFDGAYNTVTSLECPWTRTQKATLRNFS